MIARGGSQLLSFEELRDFITSRMRLSHIYQPLLIKTLVESGGVATVRQLAGSFLAHDESQLLYYENTLKKMPIKVLTSHGILKREGELVTLGVKKLTLEQKAEIKMLCEQRMQEYVAARGLSIWDYRMLDDSPVSDSLAYRVLKEAKGRCALCGATKDDRPLDIDHIIPRSKGGKTVYENLQVLCSKCNRTKRDKDDIDFRKIVEKEHLEGCVFCERPKDREVFAENDHAYTIGDGYEVTVGHTLVIPKRHFEDYFDITWVEQKAIHDIVKIREKQLRDKDKTIGGFNVGVNAGKVAGQTIMHCHVHLIPRRDGDTENPRGGVRGVIPGKMSYEVIR
jgi:diadenosine tetraphosphate (Ap4A) HIT family hydrolase